MACHDRHERGKSNSARLSSRDASLLAHLSDREYTSPSRLAKHLNISQATVSEAIAQLIDFGYVQSSIDDNDARRQRLSLSGKGREALSQASVLDSDRLKQVLKQLSAKEREQAVHGLRLLAQAAYNLNTD